MTENGQKRGQVTVFIIIALVIVAAGILYFVFRGTLTEKQSPTSIEPAYTNFLSCLEDNVITGVGMLKSQAGYIYLPEMEIGSHYYPFNSQLGFLGSPVPYWYYVSGNGLQKSQVPTKAEMEKHLERFIEERIRDCNFQAYYEQGFVITMNEPNADVAINDESIDVNLQMDTIFEKGYDVFNVKNFKQEVVSSIGSLYDSAIKVYDYEQEKLFLENYSVDVMRLYAPVDGIEITCSPKIWNADEVFDNLQIAFEQNMIAMWSNIGDGYYKPDIPISSDMQVRFLNSRTWPNTIEVAPSDENILIANPVGNQQGLGILGFCYVPYHFVYNVRYPVMVQIENKRGEVFQFPMAVIIEGNMPRKAMSATANSIGIPELCSNKNVQSEVHVYDSRLNLINADVSYRCLSESCNIGTTSNGIIKANFPQCVNGYVVAKAKGYEDGELLHSTTSNVSVVNLFLNKKYDLNIQLKVDGKDYVSNALISFVKEGNSRTIVYPEQKDIDLGQGQYEIQVYVYKNSSIQFPESTKKECIEIPASGIGGLFGFTTEKCFDVKIPTQIISSVLAGGGKQNYYATESELASSKTIEIDAPGLPVPTSLEQLQNNFILFEDNNLDISFN